MGAEDWNHLYHGREIGLEKEKDRNCFFLVTNSACVYENSTYLGMCTPDRS